MEFNYPLDMTRKEALVRRADRLIGWLQRDEYAVYVDEDSVVSLRKLIGKIIWALEQSLSSEDWREFLLLFQEARKMLVVEDGEDQKAAYDETVLAVISTLEGYRGHVED